MQSLINAVSKTGMFNDDFDHYFVRASMVIIFFFFGYQKWFDYEAQALIPYISNGPLTSWMYPVFGVRVDDMRTSVPGLLEQEIGILGALGSIVTFVTTFSILPFMPNGWAESAGGFPAMTANVAFLMKDLVRLRSIC
jgi:uncharacterized membrane protein YkgB